MFIPPALLAKQHFGNLVVTFGLFLGRDFHMDSGMKYLIESFYHSIRDDAPLPIPYREILLTARIMDAIFDQVSLSRSERRLPFQVDRLSTGKMPPGMHSR